MDAAELNRLLGLTMFTVKLPRQILPTFGTLLFLSINAHAAGNVMLMIKTQNEGTTQSKTLLLEHPKVTDMQSCREELKRGRLQQWQFYNPPTRSSKNVGEQQTYQCVFSTLSADSWSKNAPFRNAYLMRVSGDVLRVTPATSFVDCLSKLGGRPTENNFCTMTSQKFH